MSSIVLSRKEPPTSTRSISLRGGVETSQGDEMEYQTAGKHKILIDAMRKMYNGKTLNQKYVQHILIQGKKILSELDTIYDVPLPPIQEGNDSHSSKTGVTVSRLTIYQQNFR